MTAATATLGALAARLALARLELDDAAYYDLLRQVRDLIDGLADAAESDADVADKPDARPLLAPPSLHVSVYLEGEPQARYYAHTPADAARLRLWLARRRDLAAALRLLDVERIEASGAGCDLDVADLLAGGER